MSEMFTVTLDGTSYVIPANSNLLQSLLKQGEIVPHSCLAGVCESCAVYDAKTHHKKLACQTHVSENLALTRMAPEIFTIQANSISIECYSESHVLVTCEANASLLPGETVLWKIGEETGSSVSLDSSDRSIRLPLPSRLVDDTASLHLAKKQSRSQVDPAQKTVVVCDVHQEHIARILIQSLQESSYHVMAKPLISDFVSEISGQLFQRYDLAYVLCSQSVSKSSLEQLFSRSKMRVEQYQYLLITN